MRHNGERIMHQDPLTKEGCNERGTIVLYASSITCLLSGLLWCALVTDQKSDLSIFPVPGLPLFVLGSLDPNHSIIRFLDFVVTEWDWCAIDFLIQGLFVTILSIKLLHNDIVNRSESFQLTHWMDWIDSWASWISVKFCQTCMTFLLLWNNIMFGVNSPFKSTQRIWIMTFLNKNIH